MALLTFSSNHNSRGFAVSELLIIAVVITMISGFAFVQCRKRQNQISRSNAAEQLRLNLESARLDSMRRGARTSKQFAGVTILSPRSYKVSQDSDSDGNLDQPLIRNLPNYELKFGGSFPSAINFDWLGRPVDTESHIIEYPILSVTDSSGSTFIKFANSGKPELSNNPKY